MHPRNWRESLVSKPSHECTNHKLSQNATNTNTHTDTHTHMHREMDDKAGQQAAAPQAYAQTSAPAAAAPASSQPATAPANPKKIGVCTDCGKYSEGDMDQGDMQFYCEKCWAAFEVEEDKVIIVRILIVCILRPQQSEWAPCV
jgi:hypothetical protein